MKKFLLSALCCLGLVATASAQDTFRKGTNALGFAIGVGAESHVSVPAISATYERSVTDGIMEYGSIGIGGQVEYQGFSYGDGLRGSEFFVGARGTFHYEFVENLDVYGGLQSGLYTYSMYYTGVKRNATTFRVMGIAGARYLFSRSLGVFAEVGTNISIFKVGVTFNL